MKILIVAQEYPPFAGGAGLYASHLADELSALGEEIVVAAPAYPEDTTKWDRQRKYKLIRTRRRFKSKLSFMLQSLSLLVVLIKEKPAIIHSAEAGAHKVLAVVSLFLPVRFRLFITIHGTEVLSYLAAEKRSIKGALVKIMFSRLMNLAEKIICVSRSTRTLLEAHHTGGRAVVVYPGINVNNFHTPSPDKISALRERLGLKGPVLLSVARLVEDKGHDVVVKALARVAPSFPDLKYIIVSDGEYREQLEKLTADLKLTNHVIFTGKVDYQELPVYYSVADLFIMPSRRGNRESFGVVYVEAYYYKKPVIGTTHGGVSEVIDNGGTGFTVDPLSVDEVEQAIVALIAEPEKARRMGEAGYRLALEKFNTAVMAEKTLKLYR